MIQSRVRSIPSPRRERRAQMPRYEGKSDEGQINSTHVRAHLVRGAARAAPALASGAAPIGNAQSPDRRKLRIVSYQACAMEERYDHSFALRVYARLRTFVCITAIAV